MRKETNMAGVKSVAKALLKVSGSLRRTENKMINTMKLQLAGVKELI